MSSVTRLPLRPREPTPEFGPVPSTGEGEALDPRRLLGGLRRRKALIGGIAFLGTAIAVLAVNQITPLYVAELAIVLEGSRQNVVNIEAVTQGLTPDYYTNETQAAIIGSRHLAAQAVDKLDLYRNALFNPELAVPHETVAGLAKAAVKRLLGIKSPAQKPPPWAGMTEAEKRNAMRESMTDAYLGGLTVLPSTRSRVITIEYTSSDPEFAARAANATAELYIADQQAAKSDATSQATAWLDRRVGELKQKVVESERKLDEYRAKSGIVEAGGANVLQAQLVRLNADLVSARTKRAESEARLEQLQSLRARGADGIDSTTAILDSPLIQRLQEQEATVLQKIAQLRTTLREGHPTLVLAENELKDLRLKIKSETQKIAMSLENDVQIARARVRNLESEAKRIEDQIGRQNAAEVTLRTLASEVKANQALYQTILARYKETAVFDKETERPDARIISRATAPVGPFYPQKRLMIMAAFLVSLVVGVALALILEFLDAGFRSVTQLEGATGLPVLGATPRLGRRDRRCPPHTTALERPNSSYSEAVRSVRTALMLSDPDHPPRTVLVTSAVSAEGKTALALSLGALAARSGQRAIVVDADMRHPSLHVMLGQSNERGLSDYLAGHAEIEDVIEIDTRSGLHYIAAGGRAAHPADLIGSQRMRQLLLELARHYELVLVDTPPLLAVSDTLLLARQVDHALYVVRWEKTRRETAVAGIRQLMDAGAPVAGLVLSQVDVSKQARYGYRDSSYYYSYDRTSKYYTD